jgi:hypothetical protein
MYMGIKHTLQGRMPNLLAVERGGRPFLMPRNNASNREGTPSMERNDELLGRASSGLKTDTANEAMLNQPTLLSKESLAIFSIVENGICRK